jgi:hypothetical protein
MAVPLADTESYHTNGARSTDGLQDFLGNARASMAHRASCRTSATAGSCQTLEGKQCNASIALHHAAPCCAVLCCALLAHRASHSRVAHLPKALQCRQHLAVQGHPEVEHRLAAKLQAHDICRLCSPHWVPVRAHVDAPVLADLSPPQGPDAPVATWGNMANNLISAGMSTAPHQSVSHMRHLHENNVPVGTRMQSYLAEQSRRQHWQVWSREERHRKTDTKQRCWDLNEVW